MPIIYSSFRLRLSDGGYVYMSWHDYCGPEFYKDRLELRTIHDWWENPYIVEALNWFIERNNKA